MLGLSSSVHDKVKNILSVQLSPKCHKGKHLRCLLNCMPLWWPSYKAIMSQETSLPVSTHTHTHLDTVSLKFPTAHCLAWGPPAPCGLYAINKREETFDRSLTFPFLFHIKHTVQQINPHTVCRPSRFPSVSLHLPPTLTLYPLTLNLPVKPPRADGAQRQMFPVEMRIDFSQLPL